MSHTIGNIFTASLQPSMVTQESIPASLRFITPTSSAPDPPGAKFDAALCRAALEESGSQPTLEEDEVMHRLDKSGELKQVIGSQSVLSQELHDIYYNQNSPPEQWNESLTLQAAAQRFELLSHDADGYEERNAVSSESSTPTDKSFQETSSNSIESEMQRVNEPEHLLEKLLCSQASEIKFTNDDAKNDKDTGGDYDTNVSMLDNSQQQSLLGSAELPFSQLSQDTNRLTSAANLGSLLDAVQLISEQEKAEQSKLPTTTQRRLRLPLSKSSSATGRKTRKAPTKLKLAILPEDQEYGDDHEYRTKSNKKPRLSNVDRPTVKIEPENENVQPVPPARKNRREDLPLTEKLAARKAADLAARVIADAQLAKRLLLSMAMTRLSPRQPVKELPRKGHVIYDGFHWSHYPPLEKVLKANMETYYDLSITKCQSAQQQAFNNDLMDQVREVARNRGWTFDPAYFSDKILRDRVRCYYKTHIQNAKKRLKTMLRNPTKRSNARALIDSYQLIESAFESTEGSNKADDDSSDQGRDKEGDEETQSEAGSSCQSV